MSREMGYYELKLMMMNESKQLKESLADVTDIVEDLMAVMSPGEILDGLQNDVYSDGPLRAQLSLFRQDRVDLDEGPLLWMWIEHRMRVSSEMETWNELSDLLRHHVEGPMGESITKGLPKLRGRNYRKINGSELRSMIAEDCGSAHADEVEELPAMLPPEETMSAEIPQGVITKVEDVPPDHDGDGMGPDDDGRQLGHGGKSRMSRQQLYKIADYSVELWNLLGDEDEIPEWCQSKIAVMADAIGKVKHHLEYKIEKPSSLSLDGEGGHE